jgi:type VI secretion system secreted protein VgrG
MATTTVNKSLIEPSIGDPGWGTTLNGDFTNIDSAFGGNAAISLTTGTVSLTSSQYIPLSWTLSGTLSGNVILQLPSGVGGQWTIYNNCTQGSYTITVSAVGGSTSATLASGVQIIYSDGAGNIRLSATPFTSVGSSKQVIYNSSGSLTGSSNFTYDGQVLTVTGTAKTITGGSISGGTAQLTFSGSLTYTSGDYILVSGATPSGLNGVFAVTSSTTTSVSYSTSATGSVSAGGTITPVLVNAVNGAVTGSALSITGVASTGNLTAETVTASGLVYSSSGGFKFPDNTTQTTANSVTPWSITGGLPTAFSGVNTSASITISSCICADSTFAVTLTYAGGNITTGTGINTLGTSTLANSTTYHVYICKGTSGTGVFGSTIAPSSFSGSNAPSGYQSYFRRLFSLNTNSSGTPNGYNADELASGSYIAYYLSSSIINDFYGLPSTGSRTLYTMNIPTGLKFQWNGRILIGGSNNYVFTSPDEPDIAIQSSSTPAAGTGTPDFSVYSVSIGKILITNTSGQIGVKCSTSTNNLSMMTTAFVDSRRI